MLWVNSGCKQRGKSKGQRTQNGALGETAVGRKANLRVLHGGFPRWGPSDLRGPCVQTRKQKHREKQYNQGLPRSWWGWGQRLLAELGPGEEQGWECVTSAFGGSIM